MARRARRTPDRVAVIHAGDRLTYAQMHDRVTRLAHGLRGLGAGRGDRVAYLGPNHPAFLETLFAAGTLGAILVPLNTRLAAPELARHLTDSGSRTLIYGGPGWRTRWPRCGMRRLISATWSRWGSRPAGNSVTPGCSPPGPARTSTSRSARTTRA